MYVRKSRRWQVIDLLTISTNVFSHFAEHEKYAKPRILFCKGAFDILGMLSLSKKGKKVW